MSFNYPKKKGKALFNPTKSTGASKAKFHLKAWAPVEVIQALKATTFGGNREAVKPFFFEGTEKMPTNEWVGMYVSMIYGCFQKIGGF